MENDSSNHPDDEEPLDPAVERVRRKLARLMFVGLGTLFIGLAAVFVAIVYRLSVGQPETVRQADIALSEVGTEIDVPVDLAINGVGLDGDRIAIHVSDREENEFVLFFDIESGRSIGRIRVNRPQD